MRSFKRSQASFAFLSIRGSSTSGGSEAARFFDLDLISAVLAATGPAEDAVLLATVPFVAVFEGFFALEDVFLDCFFGGMVQKGSVSREVGVGLKRRDVATCS